MLEGGSAGGAVDIEFKLRIFDRSKLLKLFLDPRVDRTVTTHSSKRVAVWSVFSILLVTPCMAETSEEVLLRLEQGRSNDAIEQRRRQETLEWQMRRKEQDYSARWKKYGDFEVDTKQWRQQKDGVWITAAKYGLLVGSSGGLSSPEDDLSPKVPISLPVFWPAAEKPKEIKPRRFEEALDGLVREGVVSPAERCRLTHGRSACEAIGLGNWVGVSCESLHFNKKIDGKPWGKWERPTPGSPEERLVVDRCASNPGGDSKKKVDSLP